MTRIALIVVLALTACAKKPTTEEVVSTVDAVDPSAMRLPANPAEARTALAENFGRVYFDLDSSSLNPQSLAALQENAAILQRFPGLLVEIQGHADERGTTDYNLALGERRAEAVRKQLLTSGADEAQLRVVSFGEERPAEDGHDESVWSKNRRAEFRVLSSESKVHGTVD